MLCLVDRSEVRPGDRLLLTECDESNPAELELRVEVAPGEWAGRIRDRPDIAVGAPRPRIGLRMLEPV